MDKVTCLCTRIKCCHSGLEEKQKDTQTLLDLGVLAVAIKRGCFYALLGWGTMTDYVEIGRQV
jgi:hypothetical protein